MLTFFVYVGGGESDEWVEDVLKKKNKDTRCNQPHGRNEGQSKKAEEVKER